MGCCVSQQTDRRTQCCYTYIRLELEVHNTVLCSLLEQEPVPRPRRLCVCRSVNDLGLHSLLSKLQRGAHTGYSAATLALLLLWLLCLLLL